MFIQNYTYNRIRLDLETDKKVGEQGIRQYAYVLNPGEKWEISKEMPDGSKVVGIILKPYEDC